MSEHKKRSFCGKTAVRVLSMCLILAMLLALLPASLLPEAEAATSVLVYFKNSENVRAHMMKLAEIIRPKFDIVKNILKPILKTI
mgnify:CR=1 FL=1